jgi:hypothetical protein
MKKLTTIIIMVLLIAAMIIPQTGCKSENEEIEPVASESNRWLELLKVLPENEVTLKSAYLQDESYLNEKKQQYPEITEEYPIIRDHPLLLGSSPSDYSDKEWKETLGFVKDDVDQRIYAGELPMSYYEAVRGRFSWEDVDNAARTGPMNELLEVIPYHGYEFYSWDGDNDIHFQFRSGVRPLGRGHRLAIIDDFILWVRWTDGIKEMIDSYQGNIASLADNEDYKLLAGALEELDTVTAYFSAESQSVSYIEEVYKDIIEDPSNEFQQTLVEEIQRELRLKPYQAFATGAGLDKKGYYLVIALANSDEELAEENATLLEQRINQSNLVSASVDQNIVRWKDIIDSVEIDSKGRLTIAKLYGKAAGHWVCFNVMAMLSSYEPLLIHE